jgi:squalene synthase HpnC
MDALLKGAAARCTVEEAYALCKDLAETHYENFSVGSWLLPRDTRKHFYAVYAFCRFVDDLGDEFEGDRMQALDFWEEEVERCYHGSPVHPYTIALQETIAAFDIPREPFARLIAANRMDQNDTRYATYQDLDYYCRHSANPVGHLVLYVCGYGDEERQRLSDFTCTALQLANFWQDVARDYAMGRVYIPVEDMERFGYSEEELARGSVTDAFRALMAYEVERARDLFDRGMGLVDTLGGRIKLDVALFSLGGMKVLDAIERQRFDVLSSRPKVSRAAKMRLMASATARIWLLGGLKPRRD